MAHLSELEQYEVGIYQLETTDPVVGGADGVSNLPAKHLANRTAWLKKQIDDMINGVLTVYDADRLGGSTKQELIDTITAAILGGAASAYDTLLELQQEIQANDGDISNILATLSQKLGVNDKAADSELLDGLDSSAFAQLDAQNVFLKNQIYANNTGLHFKHTNGSNRSILRLDTTDTMRLGDTALPLALRSNGECTLDGDDVVTRQASLNSRNGYMEFGVGASDSYMIQTMRVTASPTVQTLSFPVAFPTECIGIVATGGGSTVDGGVIGAEIVDRYTYKIGTQYSGDESAHLIAIGY